MPKFLKQKAPFNGWVSLYRAALDIRYSFIAHPHILSLIHWLVCLLCIVNLAIPAFNYLINMKNVWKLLQADNKIFIHFNFEEEWWSPPRDLRNDFSNFSSPTALCTFQINQTHFTQKHQKFHRSSFHSVDVPWHQSVNQFPLKAIFFCCCDFFLVFLMLRDFYNFCWTFKKISYIFWVNVFGGRPLIATLNPIHNACWRAVCPCPHLKGKIIKFNLKKIFFLDLF